MAARSIIAWVCVLCVFSLASGAAAPLTPERLYHGLGQRIPVRVDTPVSFQGEITIRIYDPAAGSFTHAAPAAQGRVDLASLVPHLWTDPPERAVYAQLELDGEPTGAPLVLQPMRTPNRARLLDPSTLEPSEGPDATVVFDDERVPRLFRAGRAESPEREAVFSGYRVYTEREVVISTTEGVIVARLRPDAAPNTAYNFLHLVEGGYYTDVIVHRVVAALPSGEPFVVQAGDLSGTGSGGPGYMIDLEKSTLEHDFGVFSMARDKGPDTNGAQFFIALSREGTSFLDGRYTAFAEAVEGSGVIRAIARVRVNADDRPIDPPIIRSCVTRPAPPIQDRPEALSALEDAVIEADPGR